MQKRIPRITLLAGFRSRRLMESIRTPCSASNVMNQAVRPGISPLLPEALVKTLKWVNGRPAATLLSHCIIAADTSLPGEIFATHCLQPLIARLPTAVVPHEFPQPQRFNRFNF